MVAGQKPDFELDATCLAYTGVIRVQEILDYGALRNDLAISSMLRRPSNRATPTYPLLAKTTPLFYFLWSHMKGVIYETPVESEEELLARIVAAGDLGIPGVSGRVRQNMIRRYRVCVDVADRHIEPFL
ncbi:hypothetical protein PR048_025417 [Dryococelus australis]|uniref:Uncharacterized protein n=1 Tax=Dryococelus australis TaxID=614101 RepID=A0ABQ9GRC6_9NEOP|nr:hypothetical protein PR048_025417 [Dryococelus australis]